MREGEAAASGERQPERGSSRSGVERDTVQSTLLDSEAPVDPTAPRRVQILSVVYRMQVALSCPCCTLA